MPSPDRKYTFEEKVALSRAFIRRKWPYIMKSIYALTVRKYPDYPTMFVTKGLIVAVNPELVEKLSIDQLAACFVHESAHVLRDFFRRVENVADKELYGRAADIPINDSLREAGWKLPDWVLFPETYNLPPKLTTEEYYALLQKKGHGGKSKGHAGHEKCVGSGGCGAPSKEVEDALDAKGGRSEIDRRRIVKRTIEDTKRHMEQKGRGSVPGFLQEMIAEMEIQSRIDWRQRLDDVVRNATGVILSGGDDFSIRHPSKRSYVRRLIRPGLIEQQMVPFFIIDTSASMSMKQLLESLTETIGVLEQLGIDMGWLCLVDAGVAMQPTLMTLADLRGMTHFAGRGGTDFRPGFKAARRTFPRPDLVMYFTDGDGYAPKNPPQGFETVWVVVPNNHYARRPAEWGHCIVISDDPNQPDENHMQPPFNTVINVVEEELDDFGDPEQDTE